ncbi:MAG: type II secretion system secretin GspD [Rhodanobacteraceae bacterium]
MYRKLAVLGIAFAAALLAGCAPQIRQDNDYSLQREAIAGTYKPVPQPLNVGTEQQNQNLASAAAPETHYGTGVFINPPSQARAGRGTNEGGTITFNFDNQPVQAAVKAILGDVLHANYSISPNVKGTVTFATSQPVTEAEVLPILQMLLSWTGNALVQQNGGYLVVPVEQAAPGNLVPGLGAVPPGAGYAAQLFPLHYVSAEAMQKLLKPFADARAFLLVDPVRNLLVMGGTPDELANYQRIIRTFDVDWLRGMSVAVIPLQHVQADDLVTQLQTLFNEQVGAAAPATGTAAGTTNLVAPPRSENLSGMVRLIPLKQSNSVVVITPQPSYLDEVRRLVTTIDNGAGNASGLYVYNVLNVKASDLARHLNELFGNSTGNQQTPAGAVAPGFSPLEQSAAGSLGAQQGFGSFSPDSGSFSSGFGSNGGGEFGGGGVGAGMVSGATQTRRGQTAGQGAFAFTTSEGVRIAAVNENNQLLIRATPGQWEKLLPVIERLDEKPLQVQIETKVLEVNLTGEFQFGVQYYLGGLIGTQPGSPPNTNESYHRHQGAVGLGGVQYNASDALFYSFAGNKLQFALSAMESSGDAKVLSAPSTVVLNNQETTFKVGEKIPVVQTYLVPGVGTGSTADNFNAGQVQYIDTGVLLDVVPRVSPGGLVYMDIQQIVSKPTTQDKFGNYTITNRALSTEVAVQSGQTVLLGGLIQQTDSVQDNGVPFLNRVPVLGRLFGTTDRNRSRTELIVLITPRVIRNPEDARRITDEYQTQFESLKPILPTSSPSSSSGPADSGVQDQAPVPAQPMPAPAAEPPVAAPMPPPAEAPVAAPAGSAYSLDLGAYAVRANAERLIARARARGYPAIGTEGTWHDKPVTYVHVGPFASRAAAEEARQKLQMFDPDLRVTLKADAGG